MKPLSENMVVGVLLPDESVHGHRIELIKMTPDRMGRWSYMRWMPREHHTSCGKCGKSVNGHTNPSPVCVCGHDTTWGWRAQAYKAPLPAWCSASSVVHIDQRRQCA